MERVFTLSLLLLQLNALGQPSKYLMVDQFGYLTDATKIAVISDPQTGFNASDSYSPGSSIEVRNLIDDQIVYTGNPISWNAGATHSLSGDKGWWFDFSSVSTSGTYYLHDPSSGHQSTPFVISENPYYEVINAAVRAFYYNRCNAAKEEPYAASAWTDGTNFNLAFQDAQCRYVYDPGNSTLEKDLRGGWFDAGDYNKYVTFAHHPVHQLLWTYQEHPEIYGDDWNWPESGNGTPDLLDEVQWELDWLMKMSNTDGSTHIKMGSISFDENSAAPPSANQDPRYYGPICTAASIAIASMFAHASLVYENVAGKEVFGNNLKTRAIKCWDYFLAQYNANTLETGCDDGSILAGDADWSEDDQKSAAITAAVYLYILTGESVYNDFITNHYDEVEPLSNNFWGPYRNDISEALLLYTTLSDANSSVKTAILNSASTDVSNNYNGIFDLGTSDLYRVNAPTWMYHWGSNMPIANMGNLCKIMIKYNILNSANSQLMEKASEIVHYFHGVNPMGLVYLSNMYSYGGDRCANEIYHTWFNDQTMWDNAQTSSKGPAPGFLVGGPNKDFSVGAPSPPAGQPAQKSYLDFNTGWPQNSWEITEPAIYYQAAYIRLLANYVTTSSVATGISNLQLSHDCIEIYPNPTGNYFHLRGALDRYKLEIYHSTGVLYQSIANLGSDAVVDMSGLPTGTFFIRVENRQNSLLCVQKILKQD